MHNSTVKTRHTRCGSEDTEKRIQRGKEEDFEKKLLVVVADDDGGHEFSASSARSLAGALGEN